jgi:hypothetical protein
VTAHDGCICCAPHTVPASRTQTTWNVMLHRPVPSQVSWLPMLEAQSSSRMGCHMPLLCMHVAHACRGCAADKDTWDGLMLSHSIPTVRACHQAHQIRCVLGARHAQGERCKPTCHAWARLHYWCAWHGPVMSEGAITRQLLHDVLPGIFAWRQHAEAESFTCP